MLNTTDSVGWVGRWSPGLGDPTVGGWVTVFAYAAAAWFCARAFRRSAYAASKVAGPNDGKRAWALLTLGMVALGVNKQLDLQTAFTEAGRSIAMQQGWYEGRRVVQALFVMVVGALALALAGWLWLQARRANTALRRALVGVVGLAAFVVIRAASFHHVDFLLGRALAGLRLNVVLELAGIAWVAFGAASQRRLARP